MPTDPTDLIPGLAFAVKKLDLILELAITDDEREIMTTARNTVLADLLRIDPKWKAP